MNGQRRYEARARTWGLGETSKGTEQVAVEFQILTEGAEFNHITWFGYFTDKTYERTVESLRHCGWTGHDLTDLTGLDANEVELVIEDEDDEDGNPRARVRWVNRKGGLALKAPLTGDKAKSFAASMRDKIKALDASAGRPTQTATAKRPPVGAHGLPPAPPPLSDDDLQF